MEVNGSTSTQSSTNYVDAGSNSINNLTTEDFITLLVAQLENQDPTEPVSNEELLNQVSMMSSLSSNLDLAAAIETLTSAQGLSTAAAYIGKTVTATSTENGQVTGVVDRAFVAEGKTYLGIGEETVSLGSLLSVETPAEDAA